jgi:hypothetical protein
MTTLNKSRMQKLQGRGLQKLFTRRIYIPLGELSIDKWIILKWILNK